jgi:hypothetical protein
MMMMKSPKMKAKKIKRRMRMNLKMMILMIDLKISQTSSKEIKKAIRFQM